MTGVKGRSGRKGHTVEHSQAREILTVNARAAADYLVGTYRGEIKRPSPTRLRAAIYCLDQVLGKPAFRIEGLDNANITYNQIILQARARVEELGAPPASTAVMVMPPVSEAQAMADRVSEAQAMADRMLDRVTEEVTGDGGTTDGDMLAPGGVPGHEDGEES